MEARVLSLDDVRRERQCWCVPVYQRHYAWDAGDDGQLTRLWEDIEEKVDEFLSGGIAYPA